MLKDSVVLHQVHPVKLGFDITASVLSNVLLWRQCPRTGLAVRLGLPLIGSAAVLRWGDINELRHRRRGRYVLQNMTTTAQAVRLGGDALMAYGTWRHNRSMVLSGMVVIAAGWSRGLLRPAIARVGRPREPTADRLTWKEGRDLTTAIVHAQGVGRSVELRVAQMIKK
jgi:hypothetical protein